MEAQTSIAEAVKQVIAEKKLLGVLESSGERITKQENAYLQQTRNDLEKAQIQFNAAMTMLGLHYALKEGDTIRPDGVIVRVQEPQEIPPEG